MENTLMNNKNNITPLEDTCLKAVRIIDWISIFIFYPYGTVIKDFRFQKQGQKIVLATREGKFLDGWKGYLACLNHNPILYLTKIDNKEINIEIPLLAYTSSQEAQIKYNFPFAQVIVRFERTLADIVC